jgi:TatD DNase family protein
MFSNDQLIDIHAHHANSDKDITTIVTADFQKLPTTKGTYSYGIHPWQIENHPLTESLNLLMQALSNPDAVAIGEAGLDRVIGTSFELQEKYFKAQITLSEFYKKPMILHCVKAYSDVQAIRKAGAYKMPWILHGFNANKQTADQLIKMNFYLSFGKALLDSGSKAAEVFPLIPMKSVFLETDDSEISIRDIYAEAAKLRGISLETLKLKIAENARQCFK